MAMRISFTLRALDQSKIKQIDTGNLNIRADSSELSKAGTLLKRTTPASLSPQAQHWIETERTANLAAIPVTRPACFGRLTSAIVRYESNVAGPDGSLDQHAIPPRHRARIV